MAKSDSKRKKAAGDQAPVPPTDETPENLDKVRDILFGGQMRAVDQRLATLEARLHKEVEALRSDTAKRQAELEGFMKKEIESLTKKLQAERTKRTDDLKALNAEMQGGSKNLEKQLAKLDDSSSKADAELRTAILEHTQSVAEQLKKLADELSADLRQAVHELRGEKLDTATLIQVFSDVALHLSEDLKSGSE